MPNAPTSPRIAVIGSGPAGLMAADVLVEAGARVTMFEKRPAPGRKLLVAGSSGLNITYECPLDEFVAHYRVPGTGRATLEAAIREFSPREWTGFIEQKLGIATFKGTSRRWFVEGMKAAEMLRAWVARLERLGVEFRYRQECCEITAPAGAAGNIKLSLRSEVGAERAETFDAAIFALGGASWEPQEKPLRWPSLFARHGVELEPFAASNVGFKIDWPEKLLIEAEGKPIKNVVLSSSRGRRSGDLVITRYGIEGTPVYFAGLKGEVTLDLKPDLSETELLARLRAPKENLSVTRRVQKQLALSDGARALVFHCSPRGALTTIESAVQLVKRFPLQLREPQDLDEAISSSGGISWKELDTHLMFRRIPGVFAAGEMIAWDAPTGGFLLQACVAQGRAAAIGALNWLS